MLIRCFSVFFDLGHYSCIPFQYKMMLTIYRLQGRFLAYLLKWRGGASLHKPNQMYDFITVRRVVCIVVHTCVLRYTNVRWYSFVLYYVVYCMRCTLVYFKCIMSLALIVCCSTLLQYIHGWLLVLWNILALGVVRLYTQASVSLGVSSNNSAHRPVFFFAVDSASVSNYVKLGSHSYFLRPEQCCHFISSTRLR